MDNIKVGNMISDKGNVVANQFVMSINGVQYFQSYSSMIAKCDGAKLTLGANWDCSITTMKHLYAWLDGNCGWFISTLPRKASKRATIQHAIDTGLIQYDGGMS
jgi:hypothetical protein